MIDKISPPTTGLNILITMYIEVCENNRLVPMHVGSLGIVQCACADSKTMDPMLLSLPLPFLHFPQFGGPADKAGIDYCNVFVAGS